MGSRSFGLALTALAVAAPAAAEAQRATIVAHRGLAAGVPENTLAAFRQSVDRGIAIMELDIRATRDGHLVILHDETLDRTTDCAGSLAATMFSQLSSCSAGGGERIPSLGDALDFVRDKPVRVLLDVKPGTRLDQVIREVRHHRVEPKVIIGLRRAREIARVRRELPGTTTLAFMPDARDAPLFADAGAHIIRLWSDWVEADADLVARTRALGPEVWIMVGRRLPAREPEWRALHARMIAAGAQGLITDRPELTSAP
jgi:glycerophosphoryl diester phosphodiesterase